MAKLLIMDHDEALPRLFRLDLQRTHEIVDSRRPGAAISTISASWASPTPFFSRQVF